MKLTDHTYVHAVYKKEEGTYKRGSQKTRQQSTWNKTQHTQLYVRTYDKKGLAKHVQQCRKNIR